METQTVKPPRSAVGASEQFRDLLSSPTYGMLPILPIMAQAVMKNLKTESPEEYYMLKAELKRITELLKNASVAFEKIITESVNESTLNA